MVNKELNNYVWIIDQYNNFEFEGILLDEKDFNPLTKPTHGELTVHAVKQLKGHNKDSFKPGVIRLPKPRYVPKFIRVPTEVEKILYGR